jgi:Sec-independent protein translocase protein TatA
VSRPFRHPPGLSGDRTTGYHRRVGADLLVVLIVVLIVVLVMRGPKTLPKLGESFGRGVKEARKEAEGIKADIQKKDDDPSTPKG